ncbi:MAG: peptide ABC transporter substrate-binding protein [Rhabdochlamydiaceae bacterium]
MHSIHLNFQEGDIPSLHPHLTSTHIRCISLGKLLFECLTRIDLRGEADLAGAKAVEISEDALCYTFALQDNKWSDGSPVTAFHYENAWKTAMHPASLCSQANLFYPIKNAEEIKKESLPLNSAGVKALDEKTLRVELSRPCPAFLELIAAPIFAPLKNPEEEPTVFNGSFAVDQWEKNQRLQLKKNPFFWNEENVLINDIEISFVTDQMTALYLYEKGTIDWVGAPLSSLPIEAIPVLESQKILRKRVSSSVFWLHINTQCAPFHSLAIRQALALSIDPHQISQHILVGTPILTPLPPTLSSSSSSLSSSLQEKKQAQELFAIGLQESGLTSCPPIHLRYFNNMRMKALAQYLQQVWQQALGVTVELECTDWNTFRNALEQGNFQIAGCYEAPDYPDPLNILGRFEPSSRSNFCRWTDPLFQDKLSLAKVAVNAEQRSQWIREAEEILVVSVPVIPILSLTQTYVHSPTLKGYVFDFSNAIDFSYAYFD